MERKMKFAFYPGCTVESEQYAYEMSARQVFPKLGIQLIDVEGFSCCGYPLKSVSLPGWSYLSARNLAIAEKMGLDIIPLCNGCNLSFREVGPYLESNPDLKERVKALLSSEDLPLNGNVKSLHILEVLHDVVGVEKLQSAVRRSLKGLKFNDLYEIARN